VSELSAPCAAPDADASSGEDRETLSDPLVELVVEEPAWLTALPELHRIATEIAEAALAEVDVPATAFSIALLATGDDRIAALNQSFRAKADPTNVLSWPAFDLALAAPGAVPPRPVGDAAPGRTPLGDVALALQTCASEAEAAGMPLKNHVTHLILHGVLHLLGYDHEHDLDARRMEGIERRVLASFGIADPYA